MMTKIQTPLQYKKIILLGMILIANNAVCSKPYFCFLISYSHFLFTEVDVDDIFVSSIHGSVLLPDDS